MRSVTEIDHFSPGGGSLMISWQLKGKRVLLVGGGEIAASRTDHLLGADAHISILSPEQDLRTTYHDRRFTGPAERHKMDLILTAIDSPAASREIVELCRQAKIPVNAADIPELCDFYFGAQIRDGPLKSQVMLSSNGNNTRISALIKERVQVNCTALDDGTRQKLLNVAWEEDRVPTFEEVCKKPKPSVARTLDHGGMSSSKKRSSFLIPVANCVAGAVFMAAVLLARQR
ncbi:siroheme synthase [Lentinula raphanica]|nr:siroheme synthase [Lentinula raphanica]